MSSEQLLSHETFCRVLRQRREELGLTQEQVAERLGWKPPQYGNLEQGRSDPRRSTICKVAAALETTPSEIEKSVSEQLLTV